jgi:predicted  nucleic acid-binding Zn-ribbon protein
VIPELAQLIELQELDLEISRISDRLESIPAEREQVEDHFRQYAAEFLALKEKYELAIKNRKQKEFELEDAQRLHQKYKQDLMRVRNEREYTTALREIDITKKQISILEAEVLQLMEEIEEMESELKIYEPDVESKRAETDSRMSALEQERQRAELRLAELKASREKLAKNLPENLLSMYERVARLRHGQALAEVRDGTCMACRMKVRPQVFSDVRRGDKLITCDNCSRILFYRPSTPQTAEAQF